jgi:hypothetical protein
VQLRRALICTAALYKRGTGFAVHDFFLREPQIFISESPDFYESILSRARERMPWSCLGQAARGKTLERGAALRSRQS